MFQFFFFFFFSTIWVSLIEYRFTFDDLGPFPGPDISCSSSSSEVSSSSCPLIYPASAFSSSFWLSTERSSSPLVCKWAMYSFCNVPIFSLNKLWSYKTLLSSKSSSTLIALVQAKNRIGINLIKAPTGNTLTPSDQATMFWAKVIGATCRIA